MFVACLYRVADDLCSRCLALDRSPVVFGRTGPAGDFDRPGAAGDFCVPCVFVALLVKLGRTYRVADDLCSRCLALDRSPVVSGRIGPVEARRGAPFVLGAELLELGSAECALPRGYCDDDDAAPSFEGRRRGIAGILLGSPLAGGVSSVLSRASRAANRAGRPGEICATRATRLRGSSCALVAASGEPRF